MRRIVLTALVILAASLVLFPAPPARAQSAQRCFPETGQCVRGRFLQFWEQNGGLPVFGYPIGPALEVPRSDLSFVPYGPEVYLVQLFERARLELHPENAPPYDVLLGALGVELVTAPGRPPRVAGQGPKEGCRYFQLTGYNLCDQAPGVGFQTYWERQGVGGPELDAGARSIALFGLPLTEATVEVNPADGRPYLTQWFERARFEWHPDNPDPYRVLGGLLGRESTRTFGPVELEPPSVQYLWPSNLPAGLRAIPERSTVTAHGYLLALGQGDRVLGYLGAGALAAAVQAERPDDFDQRVTIRGQPGLIHGVPYGQVALWQEGGVDYSLSYRYGSLEAVVGLADEFEALDRETWRERVGAP
jgi:hypothetical protein